MGLGRYLRMDTFTHHNTDGPLNPFARVYTPREVERDFPDFELERAYQRYMHAPPLPVPGWQSTPALQPKAARPHESEYQAMPANA